MRIVSTSMESIHSDNSSLSHPHDGDEVLDDKSDLFGEASSTTKRNASSDESDESHSQSQLAAVAKRESQAVQLCRVVFILSILVIGGIVSSLTYVFLNKETEVNSDQAVR